jgi:hypothetical protein
MIVPSQLALKTHTNLGCAVSFATLDKLADKFTLPPAALPIGDASLTRVIKLTADGTFNYVTNAYCDETIIYNDPVFPTPMNWENLPNSFTSLATMVTSTPQ